MKRRTFLLTTGGAALAIISLPIIKYYSNQSKAYNPLIMPNQLSSLCDEKTIREIGIQYRKLVPQENDKIKLKNIILDNNNGKSLTNSDRSVIAEFIDKKILKDFYDFKMHIIKGWVISTTEARQCALFSLT